LIPILSHDITKALLDQCAGRDLMSRRDTAIIRLGLVGQREQLAVQPVTANGVGVQVGPSGQQQEMP
jgi:hypothetical protein